MSKKLVVAALAVLAVASATNLRAAQSSEQRSLNELRNTVINLLQGLVDRGVLTQDQAERMVADAQAKAEADALAMAEQEKAEEGAVRVPYVPEIVKDEIRKQVTADLTNEVAKQVVEQAQNESWGVPAALPEWTKRIRLSGDLRMRGQADVFASDNFVAFDPTTGAGNYDFLTINDRGGFSRAGQAAFFNATEDRQRLRTRLRLGLDAELGSGFSAGLRLATGNFRDPVSTNQTLGNTGARYQIGVDQAYVKWYGQSRSSQQSLTLSLGRIPSPWMATELLWDSDLNFEGVAANYRIALGRDQLTSRNFFATIGAFPIEEVELSSDDKWLFGGQLGVDWRFDTGSRLRASAAYYSFRNVVGRANEPFSNVFDFTSPRFLQRGNTLFDIRDPLDPTQDLFALAADFQIANANVTYDWRPTPDYRLSIVGDYVRNVGYDAEEVAARTLRDGEEGDTGYLVEAGFGTAQLNRFGAWRASLGYRHLERDAVLDAFADSDFHLGGTGAKGLVVTGEFALSPRTLLRLRYLSADSITYRREIEGDDALGPANLLTPYGVDVWQLDLNATF
jgi:hypothetical protein